MVAIINISALITHVSTLRKERTKVLVSIWRGFFEMFGGKKPHNHGVKQTANKTAIFDDRCFARSQ